MVTAEIRNEYNTGWGNYYCRLRIRYCTLGTCAGPTEFIVGDHKFTYGCCSAGCAPNCPDVQSITGCSDGATYTFSESLRLINITYAYKWGCL